LSFLLGQVKEAAQLLTLMSYFGIFSYKRIIS